MLTRLNFTRIPYVSLFAFCTVAFVLLNALVFAMDTTNDGNMTVLSMEEMESLAGGASCNEPNWRPSIDGDCGSLCGFCESSTYLFSAPVFVMALGPATLVTR